MSDTNQKNQYYWNFSFTILFLALLLISLNFLKSENKLSAEIPVFDFVLLCLATFRLIRLFVYDSVTDYIRDYLRKFEKGPKKTLNNLINCPWCTGIWMALFIAFIYFFSPLSKYFILILAMAGVGSYLQVIISRVSR